MTFLVNSTLGLLISFSILLAGCVSTKTVDYDNSASDKIAQYLCFSTQIENSNSDSKDLVLSPIVDKRIDQAIKQTLSAKGFSHDCVKADFIVRFKTYSETKTRIVNFGVGHKPFRRRLFYGYTGYKHIDIDQYEQGNFVIDILDQASKELVWRGAYKKRLGSRAPSDKEINRIVSEILANFPPI